MDRAPQKIAPSPTLAPALSSLQSGPIESAPAAHAPEPPEAMEALAIVSRCGLGETIYYQEDPVDHWYRILTGAARKCVLMADGRRQIVDFLLPGDLFGFGTRHEHTFFVEVVAEGTTVARYPRRRVEVLAESDPVVGRRIREMAFDSISRLQTRTVILGRSTAIEKVGVFLLDMAERTSSDPTTTIVLPMSRYDMADYLAIAVETVSRALTELRRYGAIRLCGTRLVQIIDRAALEEGIKPLAHATAVTQCLGRGRVRRALD